MITETCFLVRSLADHYALVQSELHGVRHAVSHQPGRGYVVTSISNEETNK